MSDIITNSQEETINLAKEYITTLKGNVLGLIGDLGTGKTVFTQGLAKELGVKEIVKSPTFVLMKVYDTNHKVIKKLVHVDAYRLTNAQELIDIGLTEYLNKKDTLVVIEWADKVKDFLPKETIMINFKEGNNINQRIINI